MKIQTFEMERWQSTWENLVEYNLAESGVYPLTTRDLVGDRHLEELLALKLGYGQTNGTQALRQLIADIYGASSDNVLCSNGGSEANFVICWSLFEKGDEMAVMLPNYMQIPGMARNLDVKIVPFHLRPELGWQPDLKQLEEAVNPRTRAIVVCNPNNPTGAILDETAVLKIVSLAQRFNCWILSDEIYQGAERSGKMSTTFWGRHDRVLVTGGLSKAYGLPGLRIGWIVGPSEKISELWSYRDYTTIAPSVVSDLLARVVLGKRPEILQRTRKILEHNFPILKRWLGEHSDLLEYSPPQAGAICYVRYRFRMNSTELVEALRKKESVLLVPGDQFEMDGYLRFGFGERPEYLKEALKRVGRFLRRLIKG